MLSRQKSEKLSHKTRYPLKFWLHYSLPTTSYVKQNQHSTPPWTPTHHHQLTQQTISVPPFILYLGLLSLRQMDAQTFITQLTNPPNSATPTHSVRSHKCMSTFIAPAAHLYPGTAHKAQQSANTTTKQEHKAPG